MAVRTRSLTLTTTPQKIFAGLAEGGVVSGQIQSFNGDFLVSSNGSAQTWSVKKYTRFSACNVYPADLLASVASGTQVVEVIETDDETEVESEIGTPPAFTFNGGRLATEMVSAETALTTGNITTATSVVGPVSTTGYSVAIATFHGTYAGVNATFEVSDDGGTTWYPITGTRADTNTNTTNGATGVLSSNATIAYELTIGAFTNFRVRATAWTSGTCVVGITLAAESYDAAPNVTVVGNPAVAQSGTWTVGVTGYPTAAATADALSNPTVTQVGADGMLFNGTSWDRARGMGLASTTGDTGAKTATGNGTTITNVGNKGVQILVVLGTVTGTSPTAVFKVQGSVDGGTNWYDVPGATTASLTATGNYGITVYPGLPTLTGTTTSGTTATISAILPRTWRVVWTLGGTSPSFTITSIQYMYLPN